MVELNFEENPLTLAAKMCEIRFRASEDQLFKEIMQRRKAHKWLGALHIPCRCGSYKYVITDVTTREAECEQCFANRRYKELVDKK